MMKSYKLYPFSATNIPAIEAYLNTITDDDEEITVGALLYRIDEGFYDNTKVSWISGKDIALAKKFAALGRNLIAA